MGRTLEPFEKLGADEADDLFLAVVFKRVNRLVVALVVGQRKINAEREERLVFAEGLVDHLQ